MYIINKSKHPVATGGCPITTWLSNQLLTVIDFIRKNAALVNSKQEKNLEFKLNSIIERCDVEEDIILNYSSNKRLEYNQ